MDSTPNLVLPYIMAAQAQKHVTHNEAIRALDAIVQIGVIDRDLASPPASPANGHRYIVGSGASGAWAGQDDRVAAWQDGAWEFYAPQVGWLAWVADEAKLMAWDGATWTAAGGSVNPTPLVGVNATADTTNRFVVASPASLFTHNGAGHQQKINKAAATDTASLLFDTGFEGRAEIGTTGDDKLHVKVSADGASWREALVIDPATGRVGFNTATPLAPLMIDTRNSGLAAGNGAFRILGQDNVERVDIRSIGAAPGAVTQGFGGRGTPEAPTPPLANDRLFANVGSGYDGAGFVIPLPAQIDMMADGDWSTTNHGTFIVFRTTPNGSTKDSRAERLRIEGGGTVRPGADNAQDLGSSSFRWANVWAANGTIQTSDARDKDVAARIAGATAAAAVDGVEPVMFRWKVGGYDMQPSATETVTEDGVETPKMVPVAKPGARLHAGFLAQEVKVAMDAAGVDFGVWGLDDAADPDSRQWLRPDQMIPVLWAALRETRAELMRLRLPQVS